MWDSAGFQSILISCTNTFQDSQTQCFNKRRKHDDKARSNARGNLQGGWVWGGVKLFGCKLVWKGKKKKFPNVCCGGVNQVGPLFLNSVFSTTGGGHSTMTSSQSPADFAFFNFIFFSFLFSTRRGGTAARLDSNVHTASGFTRHLLAPEQPPLCQTPGAPCKLSFQRKYSRKKGAEESPRLALCKQIPHIAEFGREKPKLCFFLAYFNLKGGEQRPEQWCK